MKHRKRLAALMASSAIVLGLLGMSTGVTLAGQGASIGAAGQDGDDCDHDKVWLDVVALHHDDDNDNDCESEAPGSEAPPTEAAPSEEAPSEAPSFEQSEAPETEAPSEAASEAPSEVPSEEVPSEAPSFEQSQGGVTDVPTEPNTATVGGGISSQPGTGSWLMIVALGLLLGSVVVMTPGRGKKR
jgi:hypothetical protein